MSEESTPTTDQIRFRVEHGWEPYGDGSFDRWLAGYRREVLSAEPTKAEVEAAARAIAALAPGEEWPSNEDLGGHPILGTRDDEYRDSLRAEAEDALKAARAARIEGEQSNE